MASWLPRNIPLRIARAPGRVRELLRHENLDEKIEGIEQGLPLGDLLKAQARGGGGEKGGLK
jgi:hypothetical protein